MKCIFCEEPIAMGDELHRNPIGTADGPRIAHYECALRQVVGGVNHQRGRCTCCGGTEPPDPPRLTRREAALAAARFFERKR